jgi:hypothetical protein
MTGPEPVRPEPGPDAGVDDLQADIAQTRQELGETVEALTAKLDVKERTRQKAAETKQRVVDKAHSVQHAAIDKAHSVQHAAADNPQRTVPVAAILLLGALAVGIVVWRRRR